MEDIERMAALCMKDLDEDGDDDGDLENDSDLLVRQKPSCLYITTGGTSDAIFLSGKGFDWKCLCVSGWAEWGAGRRWGASGQETSSITSASSTLKCSARIPECYLAAWRITCKSAWTCTKRPLPTPRPWGRPAKHGDTTADWRWDISKIRAPPTSTFWWPMIVS